MPVYEYYCRPCNARFDILRPLSASESPASCPEGHAGATRTITTFAAIRAGRDSGGFEPAEMGMGGGCACGGACACAGH
jgi:putative FmdB family regulatory protein